MEFQGTKGKWRNVQTENVGSHLDIAINANNDDCVAWVYSDSNIKSGKKQECQANAQLIASAPELLEALKSSSNWRIY